MRWLAEMLGYPAGGRGHPRLGRLDGELHRARRRAPRDDAGQRPRGRPRRAGPPAPDRLRLGPGPLVRRQGRGPARHRHEAAPQDPDRRPLPDPHGRARSGGRRRPGGGIPARDRRRQRRHGQHGRDRSAGRDRRFLRAASRSGSTSTARTARWRRSSRSCARSSPAWSARTRSPTDPHKWLYVPYEAGATLVREPGPARRRRSASSPSTSPPTRRARFPGPAWFAERGVELSRGFKALKVWMGLKTHGRRAYAAQIENDVRWRTSWPPRWTAAPTSSGWRSRSSRSRTSATARRTATSPTRSSTGSTGGSSTASSATARSSSRPRSSRAARRCASRSRTSGRARRT